MCQEFDEKNFHHYTTKDGLSNNFIFTITQDAYGYIWIGSKSGLNRFDGLSFKQFYADTSVESLPTDLVHTLKWLNKDELGVLTSKGLHIINSKTLEKRNLLIPEDSLKGLSIVNQVYDITADKKENIFIITSEGFYHFGHNKLLFRYDHFSRRHIETKGGHFGWRIIQVKANILLLSTIEGLYVYNIEKKELHSLSNKDDSFFHLIANPKQQLTFLYGDENYFWTIFPDDRDLALFDVSKRTKQTINISDRLLSKLHLSQIFRLNDTLMAAISSTSGFYMIYHDSQKKSWVLDTIPYFENDYCTSVLLDKNNCLWVSTPDGLYKQNKLTGKIEQAHLPSEGLSFQKYITGLAVANNKVFASTGAEGFYIFDRDSLQLLQHMVSPEKKQNYTTQLVKLNDDSLITSKYGVLINTKNLQYKNIELGKNISKVSVVFKDSRNRIYFVKNLSDSVYFKDPGDKKISVAKFSDLQKIQTPTVMAEDSEGNIWFANQGLIRLNNRSKKFDLLLDSFPSIKTPSKKVSSNIVFDKSGRIYFGIEYNGLIIYDIKEAKYFQVTRSYGLPDNSITALYLHENKTLWVATENGLASYDLESKRVSAFGVSDGMPTDPNSISSLYYDSMYGYLYAALAHSFVRFDPAKLKKNEIPPSFFIESIDITGEKTLYHPDDATTVSYKNNSLIVNLAAINYEDASQQLFAYRLLKKGNESWQEIGTQRQIFFNDLTVGKHKLQIKAYIRNQSWPDQVKEILIIVRPPFWRTTWFLLLAISLMLFVLYLFYRLRIRQIRQKADIDKAMAQTEMKALHAQMNPHFIFNCLNSIREMILNNENKQASHYLNKFAQLIRITLNQSSKPFVSLENTIDYLRRYIEMEKIRTSNFTHTIEIDEDLVQSDIVLPPMLIQPFIENAIWHGAASPDQPMKIDIRFEKDQQQLLCIIDDNGIGIETSLKNKEAQLGHDPVGIDNIKKRIRVLNEKYNMQSTITIEDKSNLVPRNGTGTIVKLRLPIKKIDV
jgi:ligand-binding sensor domain-containing protein